MIAVTLFNKNGGVFYEWDDLAFKGLGWNLLGAITISAWSLVWGLLIFMSLKFFKILRVPAEIEIKGKFMELFYLNLLQIYLIALAKFPLSLSFSHPTNNSCLHSIKSPFECIYSSKITIFRRK